MAEQSGVDRKTAFKVRDILVANGLLIETEKLSTNISVYNLGPKVPFEDLRSPFTDTDNGHNIIDYPNIIEEEESSFHSDSLVSLNQLNQEDIEPIFEVVKEQGSAAAAQTAEELYWLQKAKEYEW